MSLIEIEGVEKRYGELRAELTNSFCRNDPKIAKHFARTTFLSDHRKDVPLSTVTQVTCLGAVVLPVCSNSDASGLRQYRLPKRLPR